MALTENKRNGAAALAMKIREATASFFQMNMCINHAAILYCPISSSPALHNPLKMVSCQ